MNLELMAFTDAGEKLGSRISAEFGVAVTRCAAEGDSSLSAWTERSFRQGTGLIFIGAAGIAVRAIAPLVKSKTEDPAVIVIDEKGKFVVPILSGHLGNANDLARKIAETLDAEAVITTATDINHAFAVDEWAKRQGARIINPENIKYISSNVLKGKTISLMSEWHIQNEPPQNVTCSICDSSAYESGQECRAEDHNIVLGIHSIQDPQAHALCLVPPVLILGVGARKGIKEEDLECFLEEILSENHLLEESIFMVTSIDAKKNEQGIICFAEKNRWEYNTYSPEQLNEVEGNFASSSFVEKTVGVDNVCEKSAYYASGCEGQVIVGKRKRDGMTMALVQVPYHPSWNQGKGDL